MIKVELSPEQLVITSLHLQLHIKKTERDLASCGSNFTKSDQNTISEQMDKLRIICSVLENAVLSNHKGSND